MKSAKYQKRFYRNWVSAGNLHEARLCVKETDLHIMTDRTLDEAFCLERICRYRGQIEDYIHYKDLRFLSSLKPIAVELTAPRIVREMAAQSRKANVGPMAAVAGAVAQFLGKDLLKKGYKEVIIENGGDLFLNVSRAVTVGIYAGQSQVTRKISLAIDAHDTPMGIATSSGTVGHSLSFGSADSVTIIAKNAVFADSCATAVANRVRGKKDMESAIAFAQSVRGIRGVLIIVRHTLAAWGAVKLA
jgi:uncharacterized protein